MRETSKKRILVFIDWYLPGYKAGGGQRAFANLVSYLRDEIDFYIVTRDTDFLEKQSYEGVKSDGWNIRNPGEHVYYSSEKKVSFKLFAGLMDEVQADLAYVNGIYSPKFSVLPLIVLRWKRFSGKVVVGSYGMLASTAIRIKQGKKKFFLKTAKTLGFYRHVRFHATSGQEEEDIRRVFGRGVEVMQAPHLPVRDLPEYSKTEKSSGLLRLISVARISPEKNTLFALECLKELSPNAGKVIFDLFGPLYDQDYWDCCKRVIHEMPENVEVHYKGIVKGSEVIKTIAGYHFLFMPTRGENFGYVILESFMAGRPVLISDKTPWRDLATKKAGFDLPLQQKQAFVQTINEMVALEQSAFDAWCEGALYQAKEFVENPELKEGNRRLFL